MNKIVFFSGLDCSGKSTQISNLENKLKNESKKVLVFWSRGGYTNNFQNLKDFLRRFAGKKLPKPGFTPQRQKALSNPIVRRVWLTIAMVDLIFYYSIYLRLKYYLNYNIICDRHIIDTNIDFKLTYPMEKTDKWFLWKFLKLTALKPHFHFVSTVPVKESVIRSKFKFEPYPDSPEILSLRLSLYNEELRSNDNLCFIDGMDDKNEIRENILKIIASK